MTLTTMLLAGGRSRRMGKDKATMALSGEPLWQRQLRVLQGLAPLFLCVSGRGRPPWCPPELEVVADQAPSRGPLSGVAAGLSRLRTSHLLVLAIDLPRVSTDHLRKIWSRARPGIGVIPRNKEYFEPLCAVYPAEAAVMAHEALKTQDASLQQFARTLLHEARAEVYPLTLEERSLYLNLNTPADLPAEAKLD